MFSENKDIKIETGVAFCSETGKRLGDIRYDQRDLMRKSSCKNTWAQDVVKALFSTESKSNTNLISSAESVLSNLHKRANQEFIVEKESSVIPENFSKLEKRTRTLKLRKVKKEKNNQLEDNELISIIESIVDKKLAKI